MNWIDWIIVLLMVGGILGGLAQGFFRSASSLLGLIFGLALATWNYEHAARIFEPLVHDHATSEAIAFVLITILVMIVCGIVGRSLAKGFKWLGLGCLDHLLGAGFGFLQGSLLVVLGILVMVAFFPGAGGLHESKFAPPFLQACRAVTHMSPNELAEKISDGLKKIEEAAPNWLHP